MRNKWLVILMMGFVVGILSGCSQAEEILEKVSQLLDQQQDDIEDVQGDSMPNNDNATGENSDQNNDSGSLGNEENSEEDSEIGFEHKLPFDERLLSQGYDNKILPNGFPMTMPYHWILVKDNLDDPAAEVFEGTFCFDIPMEIKEIAESFDEFYDINHEHYGADNEIIHTSTFEMSSAGWTGVFEYYLDEYDNTCASATISYGHEAGEEFYGEDPETMMSEEELAAERARMEEENENNGDGAGIYEDRKRSLPDDFVEKLNHHREPGDLVDMDVDADDILSIREKIRNGEIAMLRLNKGLPSIFPYEWYLLKEDDDPINSGWSGTFCTDAQMRPTIVKHLDMLADVNADINSLSINESPQMNEKGNVEFAFNDEYGTGSWQGTTIFYIDRVETFQVHKCAKVSMQFSSDILQ